MQVKKEELKNDIIEAAKNEFLNKGYEGASMRQIADKAHTTLGNLYNYFTNKEELLGVVLSPSIKSLNKLVEVHLNEEIKVHSLEEVDEALKQFGNFFDESDFRYFMDERIIILFDLKSTRYKEKRDWFLIKFKQHMAWHLNIDDFDSPYIDIITNMFIDCIRHVLDKHQDLEMQKEEFLKVFKMLCTGIVVNEQK
ncbi:MAG: TetR/AcrR family transcriptional regulator [Thomasclavelia sp.]|uniref:TetR/AcrR family transcriptional regulator n=1 Tax=Thomasclavelia sp. TaxID=3025757 RepID=UPI0039A150BD